MSPKKRSAGRCKGFFASFTCLETTCVPTQTRNRTPAPVSNTKVDHSSTAPKANTAKIRREHRPRTRTHCTTCGSRACPRARRIESVMSTIAYDDIFNTIDPSSIFYLLFLHQPEIVDP